MSETSAEPLSRRAKLLGTLLIALIVLSPLVWMPIKALTFSPDLVREVALVRDLDGGEALFVEELITYRIRGQAQDFDATRLSVYELETGARSGRRILRLTRPAPLHVLGPGPEGVWVYEGNRGLQLLDASDGEVLRGPDELLSEAQREAVLRSGSVDERVGYAPDMRAAILTLRDGTRLAVTGEGEPTSYARPLPPVTRPDSPGRHQVFVVDGEEIRLSSRAGDPSNSARLAADGSALLRPYLLALDGEQQLIGGPASVLVVHEASLDDGADTLLSRVDVDSGEILWTATLGEGELGRITLAHRMDDAVVLMLAREQLLAVELDSGAERYRVEL